MKPHVLIAMPNTGLVDMHFTIQLANLVSRKHDYTISVETRVSSMVHKARCRLVEHARKIGATHIWFLDTDMIVPEFTLDKLLAHRKMIVGCVYRKRLAPHTLVGTEVKPRREYGDCREMERLPTGCLLIDLAVFDDWPLNENDPWFEFVGIAEGEDYSFCRKAIERGHTVWCDIPLSMELGHLTTVAIWTNGKYDD